MTLQEIEKALDAGLIEVAMRGGRWWRARRNGRAQTWKRDPARFRIPIKFGLYGTGAITPGDFEAGYYRIAGE